MNKLWLLAISLLFVAAPARAQTNDQNWRSWAWIEETPSARAAGFGGAAVANPDSFSPYVNPAGMAMLEKTEISASAINRGTGDLTGSDEAQARTGVGYVGGAGRITNKIALGAYVAESHDLRLRVVSGPGAARNATGDLDTTVTDAGVALGWAPSPRVAVGFRVNITHLRAQGLVRDIADGFDAGTASAQTRVAGDAGVLFKLSDELSLGGAYAQGVRWDAERTARTSGGLQLEPVAYQVSSPSRLSGGLAYRPSVKLLLVGQVDYLLYERLKDTFRIVRAGTSPDDYQLKNELEARGGIEVSIPIGSVSVQGRAGVHRRAPGSFRYDGGSAAEGSVFAGLTRETLGSVGASVVWTRGFRIDGALILGDIRTAAVLGVGVHF